MPARFPGYMLAFAFTAIFAWPSPSSAQPSISYERVSLTNVGAQVTEGGSATAMSADGRYVFFEATSPDLPGFSTQARWYVRDRASAETRLLDFWSFTNNVTVSGDGNYLAYVDFLTESRIHVFARATGAAVWTSGYGTGYGMSLSLSANGNRLAFAGSFWDGTEGIFIHDLSANVTTRVSVASDGTAENGYSQWPAISGDGRWVAFVSSSTNLVAGDVNGVADTFLLDSTTGTMRRLASVPLAAPTPDIELDRGPRPVVSDDGRFVALVTGEALSAADTNGSADIYVYDRDTGIFEWVSAGAQYESHLRISGDGRAVSYNSDGLHWHDRQTGASVDLPGVYVSGISRLGCELATTSGDGQLVAGDTNNRTDAFVATIAPCGPPAPTLSVSGSPVIEGSGAGNLRFTVSLSAPSPAAVTVDYATSDETATAGVDYLSTSGTLTFAAGDTVKTIEVPVLGDLLEESNEIVRLSLTNASGAAIGNDNALSTILDDDDQTPPVLSLPADISLPTITPGGVMVEFDVSATDNRDPAPAVSCNPPSRSVFPVGRTVVQCSATDAAGYIGTGSFAITIVPLDIQRPELSLPADIEVDAASEAGRQVAFTVTATDNWDPSPLVKCNPPSGSLFPSGMTVVECKATDAAGNFSVGHFTVNVRPIMVELAVTIVLSAPLRASESISVFNNFTGQDCVALVTQQTCTVLVPHGTAVRLTARNRTGSPILTGWNGCDYMNDTRCGLTLLGNQTVRVEFSRRGPRFDWWLSGRKWASFGLQELMFGVSIGRTADGRLLSGSIQVVSFSWLNWRDSYYLDCGDFVSMERFGSQVIVRTTNGWKQFVPWVPGVGGLSCLLQFTDSDQPGGRDHFNLQVFGLGSTEFSWMGDAPARAFALWP
jgi:Tol biopolymer transport system component